MRYKIQAYIGHYETASLTLYLIFTSFTISLLPVVELTVPSVCHSQSDFISQNYILLLFYYYVVRTSFQP